MTAVAAALALAYGGQAQAFEFETESGWKGSFNNTISLGSSWRAEAPNSKLFSAGDGNRIGVPGGTGGTNTDSGNLNWDKGDRFATPLKLVSELSMRRGDMGGFIRAKAWYDQALNDESVRAGNGDQGHTINSRLSDSSQPRFNKYDGIELLDAYVYNTFDVGGKPLQLRAGRQVVNWGESLFIQGLNQLNPVDVSSLRKPGTEVKEALLPVWSLYGSLGLGGGASLEAFYQIKWEGHNIDQCGGYWSPVEWGLGTSTGSTGCRQIITTLGTSGNAATVASGGYIPLANGKDGKDSGQGGLAFRIPVEKIDSEIGFYAMQINSRAPIVSGYAGTWGAFAGMTPAARGAALRAAAAGYMSPLGGFAANPALAAAGVVAAKGFWEYPDKVEIYGASLSTNIAGWSVGTELSYTPKQPVQINANDLLAGMIFGVGPMGAKSRAMVANGSGSLIQGYDRMEKTQFQVNTIKILPNMLGASQGLLVAEVGMQWNDLPNNGRRYGRGFIFGSGSDPSYAGLVSGGNTCGTSVNPQADGCKNDGYVTDYAWGYRVKASLEYPGLIGGYTVTPSVFWGHDVKGYSSDGQFIEDRQALTLGAKFDYNKKYVLEFGYTTFANKAKYDPFRDRDFYSAALSATF
jgi:hypothetical protein